MVHSVVHPATAVALLLGAACVPVGRTSPPGTSASAAPLPDTSAQQALVHEYLDLVAAERYADAWQLLTPDRQRPEPPAAFEGAWRARGRLALGRVGGRFLWPADVDEVRADAWLDRPDGSGALERWSFRLALVGSTWRVVEERPLGPTGPATLPRSPDEAVRRFVIANYGPLWLPTVTILHQEPFADGHVVAFRVLNPLLDRRAEPTPTAILLFLRPRSDGWAFGGGGGIGTIAEMDRYAVACAWTWLRYGTGEPTVAAFYCTVEDPRGAAIELDSVEGHRWRADVRGRRAVLFPYAWDLQAKWPTQQPRAIRLVDAAGQALDLPTSPLAGER